MTTPAPNLKFERRSAPRLRGIDYDFPEQTAQGVCLFSRFPDFTLSDKQILAGGPWYSTVGANGHFTHGITTIEAKPAYRDPLNVTTNAYNLPYTQKHELLNDPQVWDYAGKLADELAAVNPNDARIPALRTMANDHAMSNDQAAFTALGSRIWQSERGIDSKNQGMKYFFLDVEQTGGWEYQRNCFGWMDQGAAASALAAGIVLAPCSYSQWTGMISTYYGSTIDSTTGLPSYLSSTNNPIANDDPTLHACNTGGGNLQMTPYMSYVWGNEPFYKRNADGSLQLSGGQPVFNNTNNKTDVPTTTCYGCQLPLNANEAQLCVQQIYDQAGSMYMTRHFFAAQYPANSTLCQSFLTNTRGAGWLRYTNEGVYDWQNNPIIPQNDRPLPGWEFELIMALHLFIEDAVVTWSSDMDPCLPLGGDNKGYWPYNNHGVVEYMIKAMHRYSILDPLHQGTFQWCWFHLPVVSYNTADGERYYQKPLAFGKIRTYNGQPWLELLVAWPTLDNQSADLKVWIEKDGNRSPTYTIQLANGRSYFLDAWQLPVGFSGLEGKHVKLQFKDQMGVTRTWCGDYRVAP